MWGDLCGGASEFGVLHVVHIVDIRYPQNQLVGWVELLRNPSLVKGSKQTTRRWMSVAQSAIPFAFN